MENRPGYISKLTGCKLDVFQRVVAKHNHQAERAERDERPSGGTPIGYDAPEGPEGAMNAGSADRYSQSDKRVPETTTQREKFVPEGVEGRVPYRGSLAEFVYQLVGGVRASMGYNGCATIEAFRRESQFCKVSGATVIENHPHDIRITKNGVYKRPIARCPGPNF